MSAIERLRQRLAVAVEQTLERPWAVDDSVDAVASALRARLAEGASIRIPLDQQEEALKRFWAVRRFDSLKSARLVSFGTTLRIGSQGLCIMEDRQCLLRLLEGVDEYLVSPRKYRRCYQGLLAGYFGYDPEAVDATVAGQQNWNELRDYLKKRASRTADSGVAPEWVSLVQLHSSLFSADPCGPYGSDLLEGRESELVALRERLRIPSASWFTKRLVLAMMTVAVSRCDEEFASMVPRLLDILEKHIAIRDRGLAMLLDRYVQIKAAPLSPALRDGAVNCWGNPWLSANSMRWGRVSPDARALVTNWLKLEFIEAFFSLLAEERTGDTRRLNFWKRYVHAIDTVHFALGVDARENRSPDFVQLRRKMQGLSVALHDPLRTGNAFVMTMGRVVLVEFSGYRHACYGYDASKPLPFTVTQPLVTPVDAPNSLKHRRHLLKLRHQDGVKGFERWEEGFEATLRQGFGIEPMGRAGSYRLSRANAGSERRQSSVMQPTSAPQPRLWPQQVYARQELTKFCEDRGLHVDDLTGRNGNLWVRVSDQDARINEVLTHWGFRYKASKGWWR